MGKLTVPGVSLLMTGSPHTSMPYCDAPFQTPAPRRGFFMFYKTKPNCSKYSRYDYEAHNRLFHLFGFGSVLNGTEDQAMYGGVRGC